MNINKMMKQMQQAQAQMAAVQDELASKMVDVTVGGGMVKVVMSCDGRVHSIDIEKEVVDPAEVEMLQELIVSAFNQAKDKTASVAQAEMQKAAGALGLPPGMI